MSVGSRILYLECKTGAAGDMLMGALYMLLPEQQKSDFLKLINGISDEINVNPIDKKVHGIGGIHMEVKVRGAEEDRRESECESFSGHKHHAHSHTSCREILEKIQTLDVDEPVRFNASQVYQIIAAAEGKIHRTTIEQIHFHEIGSLDAMVDVVGCCLAIHMLNVDNIQCSPICVGNGVVHCAHGVLPVPAPATAEIIKGIPVYMSDFDGELLTPTGAALLKYFVNCFTECMNMRISEVGYGFGTREFEQLSCVRAFLGYGREMT